MIAFITTAIGLVVSGGGLIGMALKLAARFGFGWSSIPVVGPFLALAEKAFDFSVWLLKAPISYVFRKLGQGADVITGSVPACAMFCLALYGAWNFGPGHWRFWDRPAPVQRVVSDDDEPRAKRRVAAAKVALRKPAFDLLGTLRKSMGGN